MKSKRMKNFNEIKPLIIVLILSPFVCGYSFGMDIYIPVVPEMRIVFHTNQAGIQLSLSLFVLTAGLGQLIIGFFSDRLGRLPIILTSSLLFICGNLGCILAKNIEILLVMRVISAFGSCGMLATAFAIIRDLYYGKRSAQLYSLLSSVIGTSPLFAPILGGYLDHYFHWKGTFYFLIGLGGIALLITLLFIKETLSLEKRIPMREKTFGHYITVITNRQFLQNAIFAGISNAVFFGFVSTSPFIIMGLLNMPIESYGFYFAPFGATVIIAGIICARVIHFIGAAATIKIGVALVLTGGASMLVTWYIFGLNIYAFLVPSVIAASGAAFLVGPAAGIAMEPFNHLAGTAAAIFGCLQLFFSAVAGTILMCWPVTSTVNYGIMLIIIGVLSVINLFYKPSILPEVSANG